MRSLNSASKSYVVADRARLTSRQKIDVDHEMKVVRSIFFFFVIAGVLAAVSQANAQMTSFSYQGHLTSDGTPVNGEVDIRFSLFTEEQGSLASGGPVTNTAVLVHDGLFESTPDFGASLPTNTSLWLEVGVRPTGVDTAPFTTLSPRNPMRATPFAIHSLTAESLSGSIPVTQIGSGLVSGVELDHLNGVTNNIQLQLDEKLSSNNPVVHNGQTRANAAARIRRSTGTNLVEIFYDHVTNAVPHLQSGDELLISGVHFLHPGQHYYSSDLFPIPMTTPLYLRGLSNVVIRGLSNATIELLDYGHGFTLEATTNITFVGLMFTGSSEGVDGKGIAAMINHRSPPGITNYLTTVRDCRFVDVPDQCISHCWGIGSNRQSYAWVVDGCYFENIGTPLHPGTGLNDGSFVSGAPHDLIFTGNRADGVNYGPGIEFDGAGGVSNRVIGESIISGNILKGIYAQAIATLGVGGNTVRKLIVQGNHIAEHTNSFRPSEEALIKTYGISDSIFANNVFEAGQRSANFGSRRALLSIHQSLALAEPSLSTNVIVSGNVFIGGTYGLFAVRGVQGLSVTGNTFRQQAAHSAFIWANGAVISGNVFQGAGTLDAGSSAIYCWRNVGPGSPGPMDNYVVFGNMLNDEQVNPTTEHFLVVQPNGYSFTNLVAYANSVVRKAPTGETFILNTAKLRPPTTIGNANLTGTSTSANSVSYLAFNDAAGLRHGFVGDASNGDQDIFLSSDLGGLRFNTVGDTRVWISPTGAVGIGTQNPKADLSIQGDVHYSGILYSESNSENMITGDDVDVDSTLEKLLGLPLMTWRTDSESTNTIHMGTSAEDFYSAFGLGLEEMGISILDAQGVTFAAIQALYHQSGYHRIQIQSELESLRDELTALQETESGNQPSPANK